MRALALGGLGLLLVASGCASSGVGPELEDRVRLYQALRSQGYFPEGRRVLHLSHVCDLDVDGVYPEGNVVLFSDGGRLIEVAGSIPAGETEGIEIR